MDSARFHSVFLYQHSQTPFSPPFQRGPRFQLEGLISIPLMRSAREGLGRSDRFRSRPGRAQAPEIIPFWGDALSNRFSETRSYHRMPWSTTCGR